MSQLIAFLQTHATLTNILLVGGTLVSILTVVGNALKALAPAGSKAAHFADLCLALAIDVQKAAQAVQRLFGSSSVAAVAKGLVLVPLLVLGLSRPAHAESMAALGPQISWHISPTPSLLEARLDGAILNLAPGLGLHGYARYKNLDAGAAVFGSALIPIGSIAGLKSVPPGFALSIGPLVCHNKLALCLGARWDLTDIQHGVTGLFKGFTWAQNFGIVFSGTDELLKALHLQVG